MPRPSLGAHLKFSNSDGIWLIRDGQRKRSTGCAEQDRAGAERALAEYLADKHEPSFGRGHPAEVTIVDVLLLYARERAPHTLRPDVVGSASPHLGAFFSGKVVDAIGPDLCARYVAWRTGQPQARYKDPATAPKVGRQTARRELEVLRAAIGYAYRSRKLRYLVPVELPAKSDPRERWLTRDEVAHLVRAALGFRRAGRTAAGAPIWRRTHDPEGNLARSRHLARFILLGVYTGTRHEAMLRLRWTPSIDSGWVDLAHGIVYRKGSGEGSSKKRRTPVPISGRLLAHLRRWSRASTTHVVEYAGGPTLSVKRSWLTARVAAGLGEEVVPHVLRHTFATWAIRGGQPFGKVARALGTTERIVESVYGHHAPDHLRGVVEGVAERPAPGARAGRPRAPHLRPL